MVIPPEVIAFKDAAEQFCAWVEALPEDPALDLHEAMTHVSELYSLAVRMPGADPEDTVDDMYVDKNGLMTIYRRFGHLPFQYYSETLDPMDVPSEETGTGDLSDDLRDIYADVKTGLEYYRAGHPIHAVFHWKFMWGIHWGDHATSALRAMHCYMMKTDAGG